MKLKCPILLKPLDTIIQENYHAFYPSEPFRITHFKMRHPVFLLFQLSGHHVSVKEKTFQIDIKSGHYHDMDMWFPICFTHGLCLHF